MNLPDLFSDLCTARISLGRDGAELVIKAPSGTLTPERRSGLLAHKAALLTMLPDGEPAFPRREWLWRLGQTYVSDDLTPADWHPTGAWWLRWCGETDWRAVPDTPGERLPVPTVQDQYRNWTPEATVALPT